MKVANTRRVVEKLVQMMEIRQSASMVNIQIANRIAEVSVIPYDVEKLRKEAIEIQTKMKYSNRECYSVDKIMLLLVVESLIYLPLVSQPQVLNFFMNQIAAESKVFYINDFNENPYIKNIDFRESKLGDYELRYNEYMPYELMIYNIPKRIDKIHIDIPRVGCFTEKFKYPAIGQSSIQSTWMSVSPNEVFTMEKAINNAKGKVLTLGCGIGYFAYMASLKEEVESVTIVELEQNVIDLFKTFILPQFENKDKITIIKADAIEYMSNIKDGEFDYCFADIWIGINDIVPYFAIKEIGRKLQKTKIDYWIEESFANLLSGYIWIEILESFSKSNHVEVPEMDSSFGEDGLRKRKYIHRLMKNVEIKRPEDIDFYMNPKNIINLINKTKLIF